MKLTEAQFQFLGLLAEFPQAFWFRTGRTAWSLVRRGLAVEREPPLELGGGVSMWAPYSEITPAGIEALASEKARREREPVPFRTRGFKHWPAGQ